MASFSAADIMAALFLLIAVIDAVLHHDERESSRALTMTMMVSVVMVLLDAGSGFTFPASTPDAVLYIAEAVSVIATKSILMAFYFYCYKYFRERTAVSKWLFAVPMVLLALTMVAQAAVVFSGSYAAVSGGTVTRIGSMPRITDLATIVLTLYLPVLAVIKRKHVGANAVFFVGAFAVIPIVIAFVGLHDYSTCVGAFTVFIVYILLQNGIFNQRERERKILEESKAELEALNGQLEEAAAEQEAQIEEISALNTQLEENQAELEASAAEQETQLQEINALNDEMLLILKSMADTYYSMHLINLPADTMVEYNAQNEVKAIADHPWGAAKMMADVMTATVTDEYLEAVLAFSDLTTVRERMVDTRVLSIEFVGKRLGWTRASFINVRSDRDGMPVEVMFVTRSIEKEKEKEEVLIRESNTDALTELLNRRAYEAVLEAGDTVPDDLVYIAFDVNRLKYVNDSLGHAAGDELLIGAADCMRKSFGKYGKIFRTGGDEFAAIVRIGADDLKEALTTFENLTAHWTGNLVGELHVAVGYAAAAQDRTCGDLQQMSVLADKRMYADKAEFYKQSGMDRRKR